MKSSIDQFLEKIQEKGGYKTKKEARSALNAVSGGLKELLQSGYDVQLHDFGTFKPAHRSERTARNPQTGETIVVPAKKVVKFKAASNLM